MRFGAILLLAATALSGAAALPEGALAAESTMGATAAANAIPPGFAARPDGLVHIASGMVFPRQLGNATLMGQKAYDQTGDYVALLYRIPLSDGTAAIVRIGMVQLPGMTAREHYDSRRPGLLAMLPGAMPIEEAPLPGLAYDNFCGRFTDGQTVRSLVTAQFGDWAARAESKYSDARKAEAHAAISAFLNGLNWAVLSPPPPPPAAEIAPPPPPPAPTPQLTPAPPTVPAS